MKVTSKNINVSYSSLRVRPTLSVKPSMNVTVSAKKGISIKSKIDPIKIFLTTNFLSASFTIKDVVLSVYHKFKLLLKEDVYGDILTESFTGDAIVAEVVTDTSIGWGYTISEGWSMFSVPLDITKVVMTHGYNPTYADGDLVDYSQEDFKDLLKDNLYEYSYDEVPLFYKNEALYIESLNNVKDNAGGSYLTSWDFSSLGNIAQFRGYRIKVNRSLHFKIKADKKFENLLTLSEYNIDYTNGWYIIGVSTVNQGINIVDFLKPYSDNNQIQMVKTGGSTTYVPDWDFNGIGNLTPGEGYEIKFRNM